MTLNSGQTLQKGKYTIEKELGRGRFGITYRAKRSDGERWAIKILNPDVLAVLSPDERDRLEIMFWQKAVKLSKCSGTSHIVQAEMPFKEGRDRLPIPSTLTFQNIYLFFDVINRRFQVSPMLKLKILQKKL